MHMPLARESNRGVRDSSPSHRKVLLGMYDADARLKAAICSLQSLPACYRDRLAATVLDGRSALSDPLMCPYYRAGEVMPPRVREALLVALGQRPFARHCILAG